MQIGTVGGFSNNREGPGILGTVETTMLSGSHGAAVRQEVRQDSPVGTGMQCVLSADGVSQGYRESLNLRASFLGLKVCPHCHLSFALSLGGGTRDVPVTGGQE